MELEAVKGYITEVQDQGIVDAYESKDYLNKIDDQYLKYYHDFYKGYEDNEQNQKNDQQ